MPEQQTKGFASMLSKSLRPGVTLKTETISDKLLPQLDVIGRTEGGVHLISPWDPAARILKEHKHVLPTAKSVTFNPDLNPAPNLAAYRERLRNLLVQAQAGKLPTEVAPQRGSVQHTAFIDPKTRNAIVQSPETGQIVSAYQKYSPSHLSDTPGEFLNWWQRMAPK